MGEEVIGELETGDVVGLGVKPVRQVWPFKKSLMLVMEAREKPFFPLLNWMFIMFPVSWPGAPK